MRKLSRGIEFFNVFCGGLVQFCAGMGAAFNRPMPTLSHFVSVILRLSAYEKMRRITTCRIIACMTCAKSFWYFLIVGYFPSISMNKGLSVFYFGSSVSTGVSPFKPRPARFIATGLIDKKPEIFTNSWYNPSPIKGAVSILDGVMLLTQAKAVMRFCASIFLACFHVMNVKHIYKQVKGETSWM